MYWHSNHRLYYTIYLPDANNYEIGYTIDIRPTRLCNPDIEQCTIGPDGGTYASCESGNIE